MVETKKVEPIEDDADEILLDSDLDGSWDHSDTSSDEDEELIRELARIKKERAEEDAKKQRIESAVKEQKISGANPLMGNSVLRRRWDDDTVFQSQSRGVGKEKKGFVNDVIRSDFHRKFLNKYIG